MILLRNKAVTLIILVYSILLLSVMHWGNPNPSHPYNYHMDEWHQFMAVKSVYQDGTPNIEGSAHGPLLQFLLSGIYLLPFVAFGMIHPDLLKESLLEQNTLFFILRANTLLFGIFSLLVIVRIAKDFLKVPAFVPVLLFTATPIWLSLSNYFKYDIALLFWILLSVYFMLLFDVTQTKKSYILAGIATGLALATKVSALPLVLIFIFSFFFFSKKARQYKAFSFGILAFMITFLVLGIPDVLLGKANYGDFFSSNLQNVPGESTNLILGKSYWLYLFWDQYLLIFGHLFYLLSLVAIGYWVIYYARNIKHIWGDRIPFFFLISLGLFTVSLLPLKLFATGNRSLVLLPFFVFLVTLFLKKIHQQLSKQKKILFIFFISIIFVIQIVESVSWVAIKWQTDPRESSSQWILQHIPYGSSFGIEVIPIYQYLPDVIVKEYYAKNKKNNQYTYIIFEKQLTTRPDYVIVTNYDILTTYFRKSTSKTIMKDLANQGYHRVVEFYPPSLPVLHDPLGFYLSNIVPMRSIMIYQK